MAAVKSLESLKRSQICSILDRNGWDYKDQNENGLVFNACIQEIFSWFYRRGNKLSPVVTATLAESICIKRGLAPLEQAMVTTAVEKFVTSDFYKDIKNPILNHEVRIRVGKQNILSYSIPCIDEDESKVKVILNTNLYKTPQELANSFEAKVITIWSFIQKNRYADLYNIYYAGGSFRTVHYQATEKSYRAAKKDVNNMERLFYSYSYAAPSEVCHGCHRRDECPIHRSTL